MTTFATETERKWLVRIDRIPPRLFATADLIRQGYLANINNVTCRVRTVQFADGATQGWITYKGAASADGTTRTEVEMEIPYDDACMLMAACSNVIVKRRLSHMYKRQLFEIDIFEGRNSGLVIAEVELLHADDGVELPNYCANEITRDFRYSNASLALNPYMNWRE